VTQFNETSFVVFRIGAEEYGLPVASVNSIIRYEAATPVPRAPESVLGVINLRGSVIPVVDLMRRFTGAPFAPGPMSRIVIAEGSAGAVGLAVDAANEVSQFPEELRKPVPEGVLSPETARAFCAVVERGDSIVILLDLDEAVPHSEYAGTTPGYTEGDPHV
jgi:purine-binding chemotaxis protein CheW